MDSRVWPRVVTARPVQNVRVFVAAKRLNISHALRVDLNKSIPIINIRLDGSQHTAAFVKRQLNRSKELSVLPLNVLEPIPSIQILRYPFGVDTAVCG